MATLTRGYSFGSTEEVTSAKLHALVDGATVTSIVNADVASNADIASSKIATDIGSFVTLAGTQTISGAKTFSNTTAMAGVSATGLSVNGDATITGELEVTGTLNIPDINLANNVTGTLPIANGGTGQTTAQAAIDALVPSQSGNAGKFFTTDGTNTSWADASSKSNILFEFHKETGTDISTTSASFVAVLASKVVKLPGVDSVTVWVRSSSDNNGGTVKTKVSIGTANVTVDRVTSPANTLAWASGTLDISGLTSGTTYDLSVELRSLDGGQTSKITDVVLIAA